MPRLLGRITRLMEWGGQTVFGDRRTARCAGRPRISTVLMPTDGLEKQRGTLKNLEKTDWQEACANLETQSNGTSALGLLLHALERSLESNPDYILLLRGHLTFNRYLHHNLSCWDPARKHEFAVASLYNPKICEFACDLRARARLVEPQQPFTSEALLVSNVGGATSNAASKAMEGPPSHRFFGDCAPISESCLLPCAVIGSAMQAGGRVRSRLPSGI